MTNDLITYDDVIEIWRKQGFTPYRKSDEPCPKCGGETVYIVKVHGSSLFPTMWCTKCGPV